MKTFKDLQIGDKFFGYNEKENHCAGPGIIREFTVLDVRESEFEDVSVISFQINKLDEESGKTSYKNIIWLELDSESTEETIDLNNFGFNYLRYDTEYWIFSTNKDCLRVTRKEQIQRELDYARISIEVLEEKLSNYYSN